MRLESLPASEYARRVSRVQEALKQEDLEVLVTYSSECESGASRYLAGFWPFFDFASVIVPAQGHAILVTGGPESLEFAKAFSIVDECAVNPLLVETSAPEWVPETYGESFATILTRACGHRPKRIGIANWNTIPHIIWEDLKTAAPQAEFVESDALLVGVQAIKSDVEIPYIVEAYRITEEGSRKEMPIFVQFDGWHYQAIPGKVSVELPKMKKTVSKPKKSKVYEDKPGSRSNSAQRRDNSAGRDAKKAVFK